MTIPERASAGGARIRLPILIPAIVIFIGAIAFLIWQNILGQKARRAKMVLENRLAQTDIGRQIERTRLEEEINKLQEEISALKTKASASVAAPPVMIPDEWKDAFTIYLGAFGDRQAAVEKAKGLRGVKQKAHVIAIGSEEGNRNYRLVIGNFKNADEAMNVLNELQIQGELLDADVMPFTEVVKAE